MGRTPIREWQVTMLACSLEYRGNEATGVALMDSHGNIKVFKNNEPAWKFVVAKDFKEWMGENLTNPDSDFARDVQVALVHTRKATKGSPFKNDNNHPIISPKEPMG